TRAMQDHTRLTVEALHRHEPHRRAPHRLADALGIAPVVLVALHVRLHIGRRHHPSLMPKLLKHPPPVMRTAARLHADHYTWWQLGEKLFQLLAPQLTSLNNFPRCINPVNLEHVLRQIQTNHANLRHGRSPLLERINTTSLALMMPSGAVHSIIPGRALARTRNPYSQAGGYGFRARHQAVAPRND